MRSGIVKESMKDSIQDYIVLSISGNNITKFNLVMLDILAHYDWSRPLYFVSRIETTLGLEPWLQYDGFVYKLVPYLNDYNEREKTLDTEELYERIVKDYRFESLADTTVYYDYQNIYTFSAVVPVRDIFATTAATLIDKGEFDKAETVLDKCVASMPAKNFPYNVAALRSVNEWSVLTMVESYFRIGRPEKAIAVGDQLADETLKTLVYFSTPIGSGDEVLSKKLADDSANIYLYLVRLYQSFGERDAAARLELKLEQL